MYIFYPFRFDPRGISGGIVHIREFIENMEDLGHRISTRWGRPEKGDAGYPVSISGRLKFLRNIDVIYERIEYRAPNGGWYTPPLRLLLRNPIIAWEFNTIPELEYSLEVKSAEVEAEKQKLKDLSRYCDIAFCVSKKIEQYVREELGIRNAITVPNGADITRFSPDALVVPRLRYEINMLNVVWIGSAGHKWNDFDCLRKTAEVLYLEYKDRGISFHVLGKDLTGTSEMTPNIHYHGAVKYDELPNWLSGCDIGLVIYKQGAANYGSPIKLFDYLSSGLLVVSTDQPQVKEILNEIRVGEFIVKNGDYRSMANILLMLRDNKEKIVNAGKLGRDLIKEKYTWRHNAVKIQNKLLEIMKC